ncbi:hypothetical protein EF906_35640, partial [Streptomyces sp. WAC08241]
RTPASDPRSRGTLLAGLGVVAFSLTFPSTVWGPERRTARWRRRRLREPRARTARWSGRHLRSRRPKRPTARPCGAPER